MSAAKRSKPFDAAEFIESLPDQGQPVDLDALQEARAPLHFKYLVRENPAHAIAVFLEHFGARNQLASCPKPFLLEYVAKCFRAYWTGKCSTLDEAFGMVAQGQGRRTPKERYKADLQSFQEYFIYQQFLTDFQSKKPKNSRRGSKTPSDLAVEATAKHFNVASDAMRSRLFRKKKS